MDNLYKNELEFLDLTNLDPNDREELTAILKPNAVVEGLKLPWDREENNYYALSEQIEGQEMAKVWQQYVIERNMMKYEAQTNNSSSVLVPVPSTIQYNQQLITPVYHEWAPNMFINTIANDRSIHPYMQGITYSPNLYSTIDNQEIPTMGEGGRRGRGRGAKNYNRNINHNSEIQTGYIGDHGQYPLNLSCQPVLCVTDPSVTLQQHPAAGQFYFSPSAIYHSPAMAQQAHRVDCPPYHQPPPNTKYNRQSQSLLPQTNGESSKSINHKTYEKRVQNVNITKPSIHQTLDDDNNSSQTNIVTTVIVNNTNIDSTIKDVDENLTSINNSNNKKFDFKIEQHIVSTINENYKGVEKSDIPCVNIKSSIEVKQNGNDKDYDENNSQVKAPVTSTTSKPAVKISDEFQNREVKDVPVAENILEVNETPISTTSSTNTRSQSWASIVKQDQEPNFASTKKPTAFIAPHNVTSVNSEPTEQLSSEETCLIKKTYQNKPFAENEGVQQKSDISLEQRKSLHTEVPQIQSNDPITYRMGEFLLSYQMDKQTVSLLPRGLTNRSNYCYINSILQALLACPLFYNLLMALPHSKNPSKHSPSPLIDNMIKFVREFTPLSEAARLARKDRAQKRNEDAAADIQSGVPFEPSYIYTILKNTSSAGVFSVEGRQEDAEEFLSCLLNGISDEMLELMKLANNNDQKSVECLDPNANYNQGEEEWKVMGPKNKGSVTRSTDFGRTPLSDIFRGQLRSRVSRATEQATDYVQPFFTLQLDIEKAESVKSALEILVGKDQLEGMTCSKTKQQIEAWKQVTLEELPVILILHLKWFDYKPDGCSKIVKSVEFPIDLKLDVKLISGYAKSKLSPKQRQYKLFAVTYHDGKEATKGHYVTDAFHVGYGGWVRYDDSSLKGVSESNVLNPLPPRVPYLLYYRRCDTIGNNQSNNVKTR
ncbi:PREDICTED: ubiquitin carboxyl-terminal hydrolase 10-B [Ceratosolen solmsi marchali]|uniref:ubiquitinyl hydrolase 1 n=1 Tax=Ceratosolen solmsi marchali TaxID=326594 RepID=A0AAJ6YIT4_9HYME|nr:PREDICTED: ubiquitin carboxyl-terminal hydrolase 10-B [Ceratosolen solmsi marchali]